MVQKKLPFPRKRLGDVLITKSKLIVVMFLYIIIVVSLGIYTFFGITANILKGLGL
jgi:hypothetical protein